MWLNIKWYDPNGTLLREDGEYGQLSVTLDAQGVQVDTILDLHDSNTKFYEAHYAMTQEWASQLKLNNFLEFKQPKNKIFHLISSDVNCSKNYH